MAVGAVKPRAKRPSPPRCAGFAPIPTLNPVVPSMRARGTSNPSSSSHRAAPSPLAAQDQGPCRRREDGEGEKTEQAQRWDLLERPPRAAQAHDPPVHGEVVVAEHRILQGEGEERGVARGFRARWRAAAQASATVTRGVSYSVDGPSQRGSKEPTNQGEADTTRPRRETTRARMSAGG